ncbi:peptidylprolyl isomerase [Flavobacteriaceae bacterium XHP0103]|uniref:peptidylprolyl isomerase n=1 Tax=Marixanthotalea marina TaxID=2844359 RepID=UPI002989F909|nr:peptidylprolyl isomerase [Marixanthotalea marina]MBU3821382.1 peptidylprolyl isomerase [Marixanthotalea marina]
MRLKYLSVFLLVLLVAKVQAQSNNEEVLFSVEGNPTYMSEFIRVYNKNLNLVQDESQKDVDAYLDMFVSYKLKLEEAKSLGYDKKTSYIRELSSYKQQLAQNFLTDNKVTESLVEEAYNRVLNEVKAEHILVRIDESANPQDTLQAYNAILEFRQRALNEGFETVRKDVHNGQTIFGEDLGYFSGFKMVYPFETAAYNTAIGAVSQPFRTQFGYHIVHVSDKRKARGEVTVAHIMMVDKPEDQTVNNAETRIQEIYKKLNQGEDFEALAKQFSDDKNSGEKGGMLSPFSSGQLSAPEFEEVAFNLANVGDISKPFKTQFGWHIVKLYNKKPVGAFEDLKPQLEAQVKRDDRSKLIDEALHEKLMAKYNVSKETPDLTYFENLLTDDYFKRSWQLPADFIKSRPLVKIGDKIVTYQDFGKFLEENQQNASIKESYGDIVKNAYYTFLNTNLVQYQEANLENENEEFANIVNEYRDGLLLFDLMENTIWQVTKVDSLGLLEFYETHKANYNAPETIDAIVASSAKQSVIKEVSKLLETNSELDEIKQKVNSNGQVQVVFTTGIMDANHQVLPEGFKFQKGISKLYKHHDAYVVVMVKDVFPKKAKTFEEARGQVVADYQVFKEEKWVDELKSKYTVEINQEALKKVKSQIKK